MTEPVRGLKPPAVGDASFDEYYYAHCCGDPYERNEAHLRFFAGIAERLIADVAPKSVLDAGCATGMLVEALRERGVEATGIDLSSFAIERVHESVRDYCHHGSIADELPARYDLIVSIEVLEHMPVRAAEAAIANFCRHADDVLFSSSPLDYKEPTHVNVHPPEYWAAEFARHGFYRDVDFDASYITPWAARFRRGTGPLHRIVQDYERRFWQLTLERNDTRAYSMQVQNALAVKTNELAVKTNELAVKTNELAAQANELAATTEELASVSAERARLSEALAVRTADAGRLAQALQTAQQELAQARDRIFHMERSAFWRARSLFRR